MANRRPVKIWASVCHHIGAKTCHHSLLEDHVQRALKERWNVLLLGDLINNGISAGSKHMGLEWQDVMDPMNQVERSVDLLMPLAKAGLVRCIVGGNHAYRTVKAVGLHPEKLVAMLLSIAMTGEKPVGVLPGILQRVNEVAHMASSGYSSRGGNFYHQFMIAKGRLLEDIAKIRPGTEEAWAIPFHPGLANVKVEGVPVALHHGTHTKSRDNWKRIEMAARGFRLYFTGHNHKLAWERDMEDIRGKSDVADFYSCGTYQGYEEYAAIALYPHTPVGSPLVTYDPRTDKASLEILS